MRIFFFALLVGFFFTGCKNEGTSAKVGNDQNMISKITATEVQLKDGTKIPFTNDGGASTIFIVRPGEYMLDQQRNLAGLTPAGQNYTKDLVNLFHDANINFVLGIGTRYANETVTPIAEDHGTKVLTYNNTDYGAFLDYVFVRELGSKFVAIETPERIPEILRTLTPGKIFPTFPKGLYNKIYMVTGKERTRTTIHELYF